MLMVSGLTAALVSGVPGLLLDRRSSWGQRLSSWLMIVGAVCGMMGAGLGLRGEASVWALPGMTSGGAWSVGVDAVSAWFVALIFLVSGLGALYGEGYWRQESHPDNGRKLRLFWGWLVGGMVLLVLARHGLVFLLGWEIMALSAFFLISTEDDQVEVRRASWYYLIATHLGTLCLFAMFALMREVSGSHVLRPLEVHEAGLGMMTAIFLLGLVGFGLKAGLMPLHFWLPGAHANAPSHVSALLSGVLIKMGVYGLVRLCGWLPEPPVAWGALLLVAGAVSGVLGVLMAIGQHDIKRLLAYHSIENIGIIVMGLGLAMVGRSMGRGDWVVLGMAGCLLHVWNHGLFKALLFMGAGSVVHATGSREIDRMGGLARQLPWTAGLFLVGAVAICGLPPLNGFVSELLVYLGLLRTAGIGSGASWPAAALAVPVLAMIGALAVACFVKVYGAVFLGMSRSESTLGAHESPVTMLAPMVVLAGACVAIGLAPMLVAPALGQAVSTWAPETVGGPKLAALAPFGWVSMAAGALLLTIGGIWAGTAMARRGKPARLEETWACGYAEPTARMQYTSSSFAGFLVSIFRWVLRPRVDGPEWLGSFPESSHFHSHVDDPVLERQLLPAARVVDGWLSRFRQLQQGQVQSYLLYILAAVLAMLVWAMPLGRIAGRLFSR